MSARQSRGGPQPDTPILEWILGGLGAALVLFALGFLIYVGESKTDRTGGVEVTVDQISRVEGGYLVQFSARNAGTRTLADVRVRARLMEGETQLENAEVVLDYLPGRSTARGGFYLQSDPAQYALRLRAESYREP